MEGKMNQFNKPNTSFGWVCPICKTNSIKPICLVPIAGTQNGNIMEAEQFHIDCIDLIYYKDKGFLGMTCKGKK